MSASTTVSNSRPLHACALTIRDTTLIETDLGTALSPERGNWRTRVVELNVY